METYAITRTPELNDELLLQLELLNSRLERIEKAVTLLDHRREEIEDLVEDMMPAINGAVLFATDRLQTIEKFDGSAYIADAAHLGEKFFAAMHHARRGKAPTWRQLFKARGDARVRRGLAALLDVVRAFGENPPHNRVLPAAPRNAPCPTPTTAAHQPAKTRPVGGHTVAVDSEGFLADRESWTREIAETFAKEAGVTLTPRHWEVLEFCRKDAAETGASPGMRRITQQLQITPKEMYALFPGGPGILAARIAGLSKPKSCV